MTHDTNGKRVLVVEDEALVALALEDALTETGFAVCGVAGRAATALALAALHAPDLAIVDVRLAGGDDGIAVAAALPPGTRILFATGNPAEVRQRARVGHGCLAKPFETETLLAAIAIVLGGPSSSLPGFFPLPAP